MSLLVTQRYNKNKHRKLPLKQTSLCVSTDGYVIPDTLFVGCSIACSFGKHRLYINQITYKNNIARITIASFFDDVSVGVFEGTVLEDYTTLTLIPFERNITGSITIGSQTALIDINRILSFDKSSTEIEESLIFCYSPPKVTSVRDKKNNEIRGNVSFGTLTNITNTTSTILKTSQLAVTNPANVFNLADKSSYIGNCRTPVIKNINGVVPDTEKNNIYIAGVKPVVFYGTPGEQRGEMQPGTIGVNTEGVTLNSLCSQRSKLLPPIDLTGVTVDSESFRDKYYSKPAFPHSQTSPNYPYTVPTRHSSNFNATKIPEFYFWPQFVKQDYYTKYWT